MTMHKCIQGLTDWLMILKLAGRFQITRYQPYHITPFSLTTVHLDSYQVKLSRKRTFHYFTTAGILFNKNCTENGKCDECHLSSRYLWGRVHEVKASRSCTLRDLSNRTMLARLVRWISGTVLFNISFLYTDSVYRRKHWLCVGGGGLVGVRTGVIEQQCVCLSVCVHIERCKA